MNISSESELSSNTFNLLGYKTFKVVYSSCVKISSNFVYWWLHLANVKRQLEQNYLHLKWCYQRFLTDSFKKKRKRKRKLYLDSGRSSNAVLCIKWALYTLHFIQDGFESFYSTYSISGLTFHFNTDSAWSLLWDSKDIFWTEAKLSCYSCVCMFMCT